MEKNVFIFSTIAIFLSLSLASGIFFASKKIKIPFAVGLLMGGFLIGILGENFTFFDHIFKNFYFSHNVVFYVFLPTLIFESAYNLNYRHFQNSFKEIVFLATLGFLLSSLIIAGFLYKILHLPFEISLLFGTLISATDPVAVLAIFKDIRVPGKLKTIIDGESLLNDASAVISFQFLKKIVLSSLVIGFAPKSLILGSEKFLLVFIGSILIGFILGWFFAQIIAKTKEKGIQLVLSLVLAHMTFLIAEGLLEFSGILATMTAGIMVGNIGKIKFKEATKEIFAHVWEFMTFVSNSLIFILLGIKIATINFLENWQLILFSSFIVIFIARPISVFINFAFTNLLRKKHEKIPFCHQLIITWSGVRGALSAAVVLLIPPNFIYAEKLQIMTAGVIAMTFLFNATTLSFLLKKLKISNFSLQEKIQKFEAEVLLDEIIKEHLKKMLHKKYISQDVFNFLNQKYSLQEEKALFMLDKIQKNFTKKSCREIEKILNYYALGIEKKVYQDLFHCCEINEKKYLDLLASIRRQILRLDQNKLPSERKVAGRNDLPIPKKIKDIKLISYLPFKIAQKIFQKIQKNRVCERVQHYRARRISSWEVVLSFKKSARYLPFLKKSSAFVSIKKQYEKWNNNAEKKLASLEKKFPQCVFTLRTRFAENSCLNQAKKLKKKLLLEGLISKKVSKEIKKNLQNEEKKEFDL